MRKLYTAFGTICAMLAIAASSPTTASAVTYEAGKLYGFAVSSENGKFVTLDLADPSSTTDIGNTSYLQSYKYPLAGTFVSSGDFYGYRFPLGDSDISLYSFNVEGNDWNTVEVGYADPTNWAIKNISDLAYDETTVYTWYKNDTNGKWYLGTSNLKSGKITNIGNGTDKKMVAIASGNGRLYGIDTDGKLYSISTADGSLTEIGSTDKAVVDKAQSACFDTASKSIIWARYDENGAEIVSVNPATAACTTKGTVSGTPQILGLYTLPVAAKAAPGNVTGLTATNDGSDNDITVSFTMPTVNSSDEPLDSGQALTYTISVDGTVSVEKKASTAGANVEEKIASTNGTHTVSVFCSIPDGDDSMEESVSLFVGMDTPGAVKNAVANADGNDITISWSAPAGKNGGKYDSAKTAYKVVRMSGNVTIAENTSETTVTDAIETDRFRGFTYTITTIYDGVEGDSATTPEVLAGPAFEVTRNNAYFNDFENTTAADAGFFVTGNAANAGYPGPKLTIGNKGANNYLRVDLSDSRDVRNLKVFTTALELKANHSYKLSYSFCCNSQNGIYLTAALTDKPTADCKNVKKLYEGDYGYNAQDYDRLSPTRVPACEFSVAKSGIYFVSIQCSYTANPLDFDDFKVEDITEQAVPDAPTDMKAETESAASRDVTVSFTLPAKDAAGNDPELTSVELKCGDNVLKTWNENLVAGAEMTFVHKNAALGNHTYSVTASNDAGTSAPATASVKVGQDHNLSIVSTEAPDNVMKGKSFNISATVRNNGINNAPDGENDYTLSLMHKASDGTASVVKTWNGETIESEKESTFTHTMEMSVDASDKETYYFQLAYAPDEDMADNQSNDMEIAVETPEMPAPTALEVRYENNEFNLSWTAPEYEPEDVTLNGYDIYCNGDKINGDNLVKGTTYTTPAGDVKEYTFYVVAVYNIGNSTASNSVKITPSGIEHIDGDTLGIRTIDNEITVSGAHGTVNIHTMTGALAGSEETDGNPVGFHLANGTYIVSANGKSIKVTM